MSQTQSVKQLQPVFRDHNEKENETPMIEEQQNDGVNQSVFEDQLAEIEARLIKHLLRIDWNSIEHLFLRESKEDMNSSIMKGGRAFCLLLQLFNFDIEI